MRRDAVHMRLWWQSAPTRPLVIDPGVALSPLIEWDAAAVGALMWHAYRDTADDEYDTETDAIKEAEDTLRGRWGPVMWDASVAAAAADRLAAAVIIVRDAKHDLTPLLAFAVTHPEHQRRGLGGWLIEESAWRLAAGGESELHLAVTRGNPAQRLYERIGFQVLP